MRQLEDSQSDANLLCFDPANRRDVQQFVRLVLRHPEILADETVRLLLQRLPATTPAEVFIIFQTDDLDGGSESVAIEIRDNFLRVTIFEHERHVDDFALAIFQVDIWGNTTGSLSKILQRGEHILWDGVPRIEEAWISDAGRRMAAEPEREWRRLQETDPRPLRTKLLRRERREGDGDWSVYALSANGESTPIPSGQQRRLDLQAQHLQSLEGHEVTSLVGAILRADTTGGPPPSDLAGFIRCEEPHPGRGVSIKLDNRTAAPTRCDLCCFADLVHGYSFFARSVDDDGWRWLCPACFFGSGLGAGEGLAHMYFREGDKGEDAILLAGLPELLTIGTPLSIRGGKPHLDDPM